MAEYEFPSQRIGKPLAAHIHRLHYIRVYDEAEASVGLQWTAELKVKDEAGDPATVWGQSQYRVQGDSPGLVTIATILTAAEAYLVSKGFTPVP